MDRRQLITGASALAIAAGLTREAHALSNQQRLLLLEGPKKGPWSPLNLGAALLGWWDASATSTITLNSGNVSGWASVVGGIVATQATGTLQPPWSSTALNGKPGVTFNAGTGHYLEMSSIATFPVGTAASTLACVAQYTTGGNYSPVISYGSNFGANGGERDLMSPGSGGFVGASIAGYDPQTSFNWASADRIVVCEFASASVINEYVDGNTGSTFTGGTMNTNNDAGVIGATSGLAAFWNGVIQETFVISGLMTTANRQKLEGYCAWKWGLVASLPSGHPYKTHPPYA